jgi:hypothetical protein
MRCGCRCALAVSAFAILLGACGEEPTRQRFDAPGTGSTTPEGTSEDTSGDTTEDGTTQGPPAPLELQLGVVSGNGQTGDVNESLPEPLVVQVTDASGMPVEGVELEWRVLGSDAGTLLVTSTSSAADGLAEAQWNLGWRAGEYEAEASIPDGDVDPVVFDAVATGVPGTPAQVRVIAGDEQEIEVGSIYADPVVAEVRDPFADPVEGVELVATVLEGDGRVLEDTLVSNDFGRALFAWYAGPRAGEAQVLEIRATPAVAVVAEGTALAGTPGVSLWGHRDFVEYIPGELPLVVTVPHDGAATPEDVPDRTYGDFGRDDDTAELSLAMADAFEVDVGKRPHLVIVHLHRIKLDANRALPEAAQGDPVATRAWDEYHGWVDAAKAQVEADWGAGFYVDIHRHAHSNQRLELGYSLSAAELTLTDAELNEPWAVEQSTLRTLVEHADQPHAALVRGVLSLGSLYEGLGVPAVPSDVQPDPGGPVFWGFGYNAVRHGCRHGGSICGAQIQVNAEVFSTPEAWSDFGDASVEVFSAFFDAHYGHALD